MKETPNFKDLFELEFYEPVYGDGETEDAHFVITKIKDGVTLPENLVVPLQVESEYYDHYFTGIDDDVFRGQTGLRSVVLPATLEEIGCKAFEGCSGLKSITIGYCCKFIGTDAFAGCDALEEVRIASIGKQCDILMLNKFSSPFIHAKKVYVDDDLLGDTLEIPHAFGGARGDFYKVSEVRQYNFAGYKFKTLKLGEGFEHINICEDAFLNCDELTTVILPDSLVELDPAGLLSLKNIRYNVYNGGLYLGSEKNPYKALVGVEPNLTECVAHPDTEIICNGAFKNSPALKSFVLPSKIKRIMSKAFDGCDALENVSRGEGDDVLDMTALKKLPALKYNLYGGLKYIGKQNNPYYSLVGIADTAVTYYLHPDTKNICNEAFKNAVDLITIAIPEGVSAIGYEAFAYCHRLEHIFLPSTLERICSLAFYGCGSLKTTHIPDIAKWCAIKIDCKLGEVTHTNPLSHSDLYIGNDKAEDLVIPESVEKIESYAFDNCRTMKRLCLPDSLREIGAFAFSCCTSIESVRMPDSLELLSAFAFKSCKSLKEVKIPATKSIGWNAFKDCDALERVEFSAGLETICDSAFEWCQSLKSIVLPDGVKEIGESAFKECKSLTRAVLPDSVTKILCNAFEDCRSLVDLTLPRAVSKLGAHAFQGCRSLENVTIPAVDTVEHEAFRGCSSLKSAQLTPITRVLGDEVFAGCSRLSCLAIPEGLESLCSDIFDMCQSLYELKLPNSLKTICTSAFCHSAIRELKIPDGVELRREAFLAMTALKRIEIPDTVTEIGRDLFRCCSDDLEIVASDKIKELIKKANKH